MSWNGRGGGGGGGLRNPCITMHQPWASLLVHGIKRVEGRSWPAPLTGRLWIHAAGKVPEADTIKAMENFYKNIYAVNGITDIKFPEHYPVSRLLGCVEVVGCVRSEELVCWEEVPESVRLEGLTDFCWLCEQPQKLVVPFEMRGYQRVYNLEKKMVEAAIRGLYPVKGPLPVNFPLPDPRNPSSLKPGSLISSFATSAASEVERSASLTAAIAGARAAATQFSKKEQSRNTTTVNSNYVQDGATSSHEIHQSRNAAMVQPVSIQTRSATPREIDQSRKKADVHPSTVQNGLAKLKEIHQSELSASSPSNVTRDLSSKVDVYPNDGSWNNKHNKIPHVQFGRVVNSHFRAPSKLFATAVKETRLT